MSKKKVVAQATRVRGVVQQNAHHKHRLDVFYMNGEVAVLRPSLADLESWHVRDTELVRVCETRSGTIEVSAADILNWAQEIQAAILPPSGSR